MTYSSSASRAMGYRLNLNIAYHCLLIALVCNCTYVKMVLIKKHLASGRQQIQQCSIRLCNRKPHNSTTLILKVHVWVRRAVGTVS